MQMRLSKRPVFHSQVEAFDVREMRKQETIPLGRGRSEGALSDFTKTEWR